MGVLPKSLVDLIEAFNSLPGVGMRTAERYAYHLLKADSNKLSKLENSIKNLQKNTKYCPKTFALIGSNEDYSSLYTDQKRDKKTIAIVEDAFDVVAIEKTDQFSGTYHVLGGLLSPIDGVTPSTLHINELKSRIDEDEVVEVILAISTSVEGESTAHFISNELSSSGCKVTKLARGLPIGLDLEYADQITLSKAFEGRSIL